MAMFSRKDFESNIHPGHIYKFSNAAINSDVPHFHICISENPPGEFHFVCCTSQFRTLNRYVEMGEIDAQTVVYIPPNPDENGLTVDTYTNCNNVFPLSKSVIGEKYENGDLEHKGNLHEIEHAQIQKGIMESEIIEEDLKAGIIDGFEKIDGMDYS